MVNTVSKKLLEDVLIRASRKELPEISSVLNNARGYQKEITNANYLLEVVLRKARNRPKDRVVIDVEGINSSYDLTLSDHTIQNPFVISLDLARIVNKLTQHLGNDMEKARKIFDWIEENIEYDSEQLEKFKGYRSTKKILEDKRGVCADMSFLYTTMARVVDLSSSLVKVDLDFRGKHVDHLCSSVDDNRTPILVDVAYHLFDIKHKRYSVITDYEAMRHYTSHRIK